MTYHLTLITWLKSCLSELSTESYSFPSFPLIPVFKKKSLRASHTLKLENYVPPPERRCLHKLVGIVRQTLFSVQNSLSNNEYNPSLILVFKGLMMD